MALTRPEINRRYRERHPERAKAQSLAWRKKHPERAAAADRKFKEANREKIAAYEKTEAQRARRAAAKRRLRQDPEWGARERERARQRRLARDEQQRLRDLEYRKQWGAENRERVADLNRVRRSRQRVAPGSDYSTPAKIAARRELYGGCCFYCGTANAEAMDHRIPIARDGSEWPSNLVPACGTCNSSKGARLPSEWQVAA